MIKMQSLSNKYTLLSVSYVVTHLATGLQACVMKCLTKYCKIAYVHSILLFIDSLFQPYLGLIYVRQTL